jgi:2-polyprenyl-3-methyl-5-hydroxy-6-metoxy-1,4-benzoquinol methylase
MGAQPVDGGRTSDYITDISNYGYKRDVDRYRENKVTDYEKEYQRSRNACGEPFPEFVDFFDSFDRPLNVLDLGCGQGRDSLMAARRGHRVMAVDISTTGVAQMMSTAKEEALEVQSEVADVEAFETHEEYDVVILDRVLHMLATDERRIALLAKCSSWVAPGGHVLIADTRRNRALIRDFFRGDGWQPTFDHNDVLFTINASVAPPPESIADGRE